MKHLIIISTLFILIGKVSAWTSSNEGISYNMDTLVQLSNDITYNTINQMYDVDCDIEILDNDTLLISAGETVHFFDYWAVYRYNIVIYGCILATGTEDQPITLGDPDCSLSSGDWWGGILFFNTSQNGESILKYCDFMGITCNSTDYETAIFCSNASPIIDHCSFTYMGSGWETGGAAAIGLLEESHPHISFCSFQYIQNGVAIWCNIQWFNDSINGPNPLIYGCNIYGSINGIFYLTCDHDYVVLWGGFLDNCYLKIPGFDLADTTLGTPIDTIGNGIKTTTSTCEIIGRFVDVDGVANPRSSDILTNINKNEIDILPTTSQYLTLNNNYPNPFSSFTTIEFEVTCQQALISLHIYDSKGNCIKQLIKNSKYTAGTHQIKWNADNENGDKVNPGIYFYKLLNNDQLQVKKAIIVNN